jgi:hypothetical protein
MELKRSAVGTSWKIVGFRAEACLPSGWALSARANSNQAALAFW